MLPGDGAAHMTKRRMGSAASASCATEHAGVAQVMGGVRDAAIIGGIVTNRAAGAAGAAAGAAVGAVAGAARALLTWPFAWA